MKVREYQVSINGMKDVVAAAEFFLNRMCSETHDEIDRELAQHNATDALIEVVKTAVHLMTRITKGPEICGRWLAMPGEDDEQATGKDRTAESVQPFDDETHAALPADGVNSLPPERLSERNGVSDENGTAGASGDGEEAYFAVGFQLGPTVVSGDPF